MNPYKRSLIALHGSTLLFGGTALFAKLISLPAVDIIVFRSIIGTLRIDGVFSRKTAIISNC